MAARVPLGFASRALPARWGTCAVRVASGDEEGPSEEGLGHGDVARVASPCLRRAVERSACVARASTRWSPRRLGSREMRRRLRCCAPGRLHPGGLEAAHMPFPRRRNRKITAVYLFAARVGTERHHGAHTKITNKRDPVHRTFIVLRLVSHFTTEILSTGERFGAAAAKLPLPRGPPERRRPFRSSSIPRAPVVPGPRSPSPGTSSPGTSSPGTISARAPSPRSSSSSSPRVEAPPTSPRAPLAPPTPTAASLRTTVHLPPLLLPRPPRGALAPRP